MNAPFQSTLNPWGPQSFTPSSTAYGSGAQDPNPNPVATSADNPLGWSNENTYAPWLEPNGNTGSNPSFSGLGQGSTTQSHDQNMWFGGGNWASGGLASLFGAKKRASPDFYAPSYQGTLFDPGGDYLSSMGLSPQGQAANSSMNSQQAPGMAPGSNTQASQGSFGQSMTGPTYAGANGFGTSQSYVGQNAFSLPGSTYMPGQGGMSQGGYSNYGGYGNSASGMQPYVPGQ